MARAGTHPRAPNVPSYDTHSCFTRYRTDQDRLYFAEGGRLRYVTTPLSTNATLGTLFTAATALSNYIFRPDGSQVFYISNGFLLCHDLTSGAAWCNDSILGPPVALSTIGKCSDQLTWRSPTELFISTCRGEVFEYRVPP